MAQIFAYIAHKAGVPDDTASELLVAAKKIDAGSSPIALVFGNGADLDAACNAAAAIFGQVWKIGGESFSYPNAELIRRAMLTLLPAGSIVLVPHDTFGMDLSPGLAVRMNAAFASDVVGIEGADGDILKTVRQEFGGAVSTHVDCDIASGVVINIRPGVFAAEENLAGSGTVVDKSGEVGDVPLWRRFVKIVEAEVGDVDITKEDVLVSVGRGIEDQDNIEVAQELAEAMGAVVSCSRPVVDAKWLEKSRQVGTSGQTVKPKVYLACGISGSFQHMGGIKGNPFIVAINKNPKAPIFQMADVGVVADILDFLPEMTEKIEEGK